jgi:hypothetical protein
MSDEAAAILNRMRFYVIKLYTQTIIVIGNVDERKRSEERSRGSEVGNKGKELRSGAKRKLAAEIGVFRQDIHSHRHKRHSHTHDN